MTHLPLSRAARDMTDARGFVAPRLLPASVIETAASELGLAVSASDSLPLTVALGSLLARARAEQVVRHLSSATNLLLSGSRVVVVGDGALTWTLARTLTRIGTRVTIAATDPVVRLQAHLAGWEICTTSDALPAVDLVLATGEGHAPLRAPAIGGERTRVLDAALRSGDGLVSLEDGVAVRPHVRRGPGSLLVVTPVPLVAETPDELGWHVADVLIAHALLGEDADARLAELLLS